ncbi:MAG: pre-16S rRNA-processing nuclease YqgF [Leptolyngbyaceae cyanobacterium bins.302]|nr:pre-16S rRNA-processing nuclease YqgF [Leptolyngbyaceae cyanobacterium bins.302]
MVGSTQPAVLGFDPGRHKCGVAVMGVDRTLCYHQVVDSAVAVETVQQLRSLYPISLVVMGDQTYSKEWKHRLTSEMSGGVSIVLVDERNSSLEARDRYWQMFPPSGLHRLLPQALRRIPRPIDDIVAILLIERYLKQLTAPL